MSLSFYTTSYLYDNIHKFECLSPNKNLEYDITVDIPKEDYDNAQSLMFFFKQMDCKEKNEFIYEDNHGLSEPMKYFIDDPFSKETPEF